MLSFLSLPYKIGLSENQGYVLMSRFPEDVMTYNKGTASPERMWFQCIEYDFQSKTVTLGTDRSMVRAGEIVIDFSMLSFLINIPLF